MDTFLAAAAALFPPLGVGFLFWLAIRALVNADRNERTALARLEAEEDARRVAQAPRDRGGETAAAEGPRAAQGIADAP